MLRSLCREIAAAVLMLCLALAVVPTVQAAPRSWDSAARESSERSWLDEVFAWLEAWMLGEPKGQTVMTSASGDSATGSCVDPNGNSHCI
jgi:hypothetical protein